MKALKVHDGFVVVFPATRNVQIVIKHIHT
jgi:hypothetical protein